MCARELDLLLINPGGRKGIYQSLASTLSAIEPPVWVGLMANFVRKQGFAVEVIDAGALDLGCDEVAARVTEMKPLLTAVVPYGHQPSASTQVMPSASAICTAIKERAPERRVILAGGHVAALPKRTLEDEAADFVAAGEGLLTLVDLVEALRTPRAELEKVRGLWYREGGTPRPSPAAAPLLTDLDRDVPGVAWDLLPMKAYRAHNWHCFGQGERQPYAAIYTTLGCPFKCSFCCIQAPFREGERALGYKPNVNSYRYWSPETVIEQIDLLVREYGVRNIKFADEMFVLTPRHVGGICDLIIARGYDLNIWAYARVDTLAREDMLEKLHSAGFTWLAFGVESASERVRDGVQKGYRQDHIRRTLDRVRKAGINVIGNYIFGLPEDDMATMQQTLDLAVELNCEFANLYCAMAYPGSRLYDQAVEKGLRLPEGWSGYSQYAVDTLPLPTRHLSAGEVLRFRDEAFHTYYSGPGYLEMIRAKFGEDTAANIRKMTGHKLERKYAAPPAS